MTTATQLRAVLARPGLVHAPGATDAVTAKLVAAAGFDVCYLSGAVISAVSLGEPDLGFAGAADMVDHARRVATATSLPLIIDADTGYGNAVHVARTVKLYQAAGVAGLHLEDQQNPKRCGHMTGKAVIAPDEATQKVRAAVDAAAGETVIIARTDARSVEGLDSAIERAGRYRSAGADLIFLEGVMSPDELVRARDSIGDAVFVWNRSEAAGDIDDFSDEDLVGLGVKLVIHPVSALLAVARAAKSVYSAIAREGNAARVERLDWDDLTELLGLGERLQLESRYSTTTDP